MSYRGRFAPTPSGSLHLGSLLTALASYLEARSRGGQWLIRMDDLDTPRCIPGTDTTILRQLEAHALYWDETPRYQTQHQMEYEAALDLLSTRGLLYACACTRATLAAHSRSGPDGLVYAGTCRLLELPNTGRALRFKIATSSDAFVDGSQGQQQRLLNDEVGDFIVRRSDGQISYQLACAVDEAAQGITEVIRGADLLGSTFQQRAVQKLLDLVSPQYRHLPLLLDQNGNKLSKQNHAAPLSATDAAQNLHHCLRFLKQAPPEDLKATSPQQVLDWAVGHWKIENIPKRMKLLVE